MKKRLGKIPGERLRLMEVVYLIVFLLLPGLVRAYDSYMPNRFSICSDQNITKEYLDTDGRALCIGRGLCYNNRIPESPSMLWDVSFDLFYGQIYSIESDDLSNIGEDTHSLHGRYQDSMEQPQSRYVKVLDKKLHYLEAGKPGGIPMVFVHGNFASGKWFEPAMELLPESYHTFALDLPNFGRSDRTEEVSIDNYGKHVVDFIKQLELEGVILVGHSLGGAVVQNVMVRRPDLLSRVVLIDPAPPDGLKTPPEVYPFLDMYRSNRELLKKALIGTMPTRPVDEFTELLVDEALLMDPRCFTENARALEKYNYSEELKGIEIPVLVIVGRKDILITEEMARGFEKILHTVHVSVLENYGHSINVENPGLFVEMLLEFTSK